MRSILLCIIRLYQYTLSPDHGLLSLYSIGGCKNRPTCSEFAYESVKTHGIGALPRIIQRIKRCR